MTMILILLQACGKYIVTFLRYQSMMLSLTRTSGYSYLCCKSNGMRWHPITPKYYWLLFLQDFLRHWMFWRKERQPIMSAEVDRPHIINSQEEWERRATGSSFWQFSIIKTSSPSPAPLIILFRLDFLVFTVLHSWGWSRALWDTSLFIEASWKRKRYAGRCLEIKIFLNLTYDPLAEPILSGQFSEALLLVTSNALLFLMHWCITFTALPLPDDSWLGLLGK